MENFRYDLDVVNAKYEWQKEINSVDSMTFYECSCFKGYCKSNSISGTFVKACVNKATIKDYKNATQNE
jgi:hypothetical protein